MNLMKKVSLAIIISQQEPTKKLLNFCCGHIRLTERSKADLEQACDSEIYMKTFTEDYVHSK